MLDDASDRFLRQAGGEVQTFASATDRERLTGTALKAYLRVADDWALDDDEAADLLGISPSSLGRLRAGHREGSLNQDQLTRASAVVGLYKGLHTLFADDMALRWPRLRNRDPLFGGQTPLAAMIEGGIPVMIDVRRHVDAMRSGL